MNRYEFEYVIFKLAIDINIGRYNLILIAKSL